MYLSYIERNKKNVCTFNIYKYIYIYLLLFLHQHILALSLGTSFPQDTLVVLNLNVSGIFASSHKLLHSLWCYLNLAEPVHVTLLVHTHKKCKTHLHILAEKYFTFLRCMWAIQTVMFEVLQPYTNKHKSVLNSVAYTHPHTCIQPPSHTSKEFSHSLPTLSSTPHPPILCFDLFSPGRIKKITLPTKLTKDQYFLQQIRTVTFSVPTPH